MTKIIVFDFDGTLTRDKNCRYLIWEKLDLLDYDSIIFNQFRRGELTSQEWMSLSLEAYMQHKLSKDLIEQIAKNVKTINNVSKLFALLKSKGLKIYILSSGIKNMIEIALKPALKYIDSVEATTLEFDEDGILKAFVYPEHNLDDKQEFINILLKENAINPSELLYVGNDWNDEVVAQTGVKTLCLNAEETDCTNTSIWHNHIETDDIMDIIPFIDLDV